MWRGVISDISLVIYCNNVSLLSRNRIIDICKNQLVHIQNTEQPIQRLQSAIRQWNVQKHLPLLGTINLAHWRVFLNQLLSEAH
jgi:hypothetical protein